MAKFNKKKLAEACDGLKNAVVSQLCNENLPKKPEDWARLFETQAEYDSISTKHHNKNQIAMKKIIRHVFFKTQCQFCGTEFAFEKSDTHTRPTADFKKILPFTECPNCGKDTPATADQSTEITMQPETENANVSQITKMQRQIDQFDNLFLHLHQRIHQNCTCENVIISDISRYKNTINEIIRIIDLHNKQK